MSAQGNEDKTISRRNSVWLRHPEQLFRILSGESARQGYLAAIDQALISASNFLATIILARNVSPTELGVYGVGFTTLRLIRSLQDGITIQPLNTFGAPMEDEVFKRYATSTSIIQISLGLLSAATMVFMGWVLTRTGNDVAGPMLLALWSPVLFWQLQEYLRRILYTRGRVLGALINTSIANILRLALLIYLAYQGQLSGTVGLWTIGIGALAALLPGLWMTRTYWSRSYLDIKQTWLSNWAFGRWIAGGNIANWLAVEAYPVMTAGMISFAAAGAYRALQNLVAPIHTLLRAFDTFLTPRAAKVYQQAGKPALSRMLRLTYIFAGIPVLGMLGIALLFPSTLLSILYGDIYLDYVPGMLLMALFYFLLYANWPLQSILRAAQISRPIFIANIVAIIAMSTFGILAVLRWEVYGTIAGQALNALIVAIILWAAWLRFIRE